MCGSRVVVVGIARTREGLSTSVTDTWVFERAVELSVPTADDRVAILAAILRCVHVALFNVL